MGWEYYRQMQRWILEMEIRDWVWVFLLVLVIGLICMRGLGGRLS
ncbi:MAG: hypothetical protein NZ602_12815 [Thermoguttaceae bacterium]|nr:hypothetical protein [Thermoguttaceae bacterium]MDW8038409.1 hypothetical protein [Thermoguttaceae bacterium]